MYAQKVLGSEEVGTSYSDLDSTLLSITGFWVAVYFTSARPKLTLNTDKMMPIFTYNSFSWALLSSVKLIQWKKLII